MTRDVDKIQYREVEAVGPYYGTRGVWYVYVIVTLVNLSWTSFVKMMITWIMREEKCRQKKHINP